MKGNKLICADCVEVMNAMQEESVDMVLTSPPYDNLRKYNGNAQWSVDATIDALWRVVKKGGVIVWVIGDQTVKGSETGSSFRQALKFMDRGFKLHDTMIYQKNSMPMNHRRYEQDFEYMFVFSKGAPKTFNPIMIPCKFPEKDTARQNSRYSETEEAMRKARSGKVRKPVGAEKIKGNIWYYTTGKNHSTKWEDAFKHPAIFPEQLALDHISSWSNEGDLVLDPFCGSGTTCWAAKSLGRYYYGIDCVKEYFDITRDRVENEPRAGSIK